MQQSNLSLIEKNQIIDVNFFNVYYGGHSIKTVFDGVQNRLSYKVQKVSNLKYMPK